MTDLLDDDAPEPEAEAVSVVVAPEQAGMRLDAFLAAAVPDLSRTRAKALILGGSVAIGGEAVTEAKHAVAAGDTVTVALPPPEPAEPQGEDIPLAVTFEDEHLIVIDKPPGLVVHPAPGHATGTLVNALIHHCGDSLSGIGGVRRPGIVHRLDADTSGLLVVAKSDRAHIGLADQFADHGRTGPLRRGYKALVWGVPARRIGTIDAPIGRSPKNRQKMAVVANGREAITHYEVETVFGNGIASLLSLRLETGRTHQIRVHLTELGHPVVGDTVYGAHFKTKAASLPEPARGVVAAFPRQALHAYLLAFRHPATRRKVELTSDLPPDMAALVAAFAML